MKVQTEEQCLSMARITRVPRNDLVLCIVSFHEQVLGCKSYIASASVSTDIVRGYLMFERLPSAFGAAMFKVS